MVYFSSNNVNGFNSSKERIKKFEYFMEKIANNGMLFLQETHSSHENVINWLGNFNCIVFLFQLRTQIPVVSSLDIWVAKKKLIE